MNSFVLKILLKIGFFNLAFDFFYEETVEFLKKFHGLKNRVT